MPVQWKGIQGAFSDSSIISLYGTISRCTRKKLISKFQPILTLYVGELCTIMCMLHWLECLGLNIIGSKNWHTMSSSAKVINQVLATLLHNLFFRTLSTNKYKMWNINMYLYFMNSWPNMLNTIPGKIKLTTYHIFTMALGRFTHVLNASAAFCWINFFLVLPCPMVCSQCPPRCASVQG